MQEGAGISLVPRSVAGPLIAQGTVEGVALDEAWARREQRIVVRSQKALPAYTRDFIRYVAEWGTPEAA